MIYYITGGARSGKSTYAMQIALQKSPNPVYVATARRWEGNFQERIKRHQQERDNRWVTIEEETEVGSLSLDGRVVVVDCVTLWLTNYFVDFKQDIDKCLESFKAEIDKMKSKDSTIIIISNEIGMGIHAESETGRKFTELQGWANQYVAQVADKAVLMVSGLPVTLKDHNE